MEWISGDRVVTNTLASLSNLTYRVEDTASRIPTAIYSWQMNSAAGPATYTLTASHWYPLSSPQENPILHLSDPHFAFRLTADYEEPVWFIHRPTGTFELVRIGPQQTNSPAEVLRVLNYDQAAAARPM